VAVVDYEAAWVRLGELIASKTQHGREPTLVAMQEIAAECRVPEGELSRVLRLYSVEVDGLRDQSQDDARSSAADRVGWREPGVPDHHPPGGRNGGSTSAAASRIERVERAASSAA
jgi:hypothetical protein